MKLNVKTTVTFTENDLKQVIEDYCRKEYERSVVSMTFDVGMRYEDRPCGGLGAPEFRKVDVVLGDSILKFPEEEPFTTTKLLDR